MKATRLTTDVRQAVVWFVLNNSPEVDADILAYREKSPDNVETNFPAWFNHKIREKKVNDGCSEELFSLACGPISTCTYPACIVNGVKFVVHERDILHTTQCSGVSTLGLDGEMYYGQLEEILELTYIRQPKSLVARQPEVGRSFEDSLSSRRGRVPIKMLITWVAAQSNVTLSVELTILSIRQMLKMIVYHMSLDDDEDVVFWFVSYDDEMACVFPRSHGGDAGVDRGGGECGDGCEDKSVVKLGLQLKLRILWRKNKQRIKADHFTRYGSAEEARNHLPPKKVWGDRNEDEWNNLVDWWSCNTPKIQDNAAEW
ncbi:hypothetical protein Tco_0167983 [Tanacetum coccineum]